MPKTREICVVFADVAGSTALYEKLGDAVALSAIEGCLAALAEVVRLNRGRVVKTIGDEIMAVFDDAAQGWQAAMEMQQRIDALPAAAGNRLAVRIGLAAGPALVEDGDVFGDTVNTAARMTGLAKAGQILATAETVAALPESLRASAREIDALAVKGKAARLRVCEAIWQPGADLTMVSGVRLSPPGGSAPAQLRLRHAGGELLLGPTCPQATLGRDPACDVRLAEPRASRLHARIERRGDKYVLVDLSSNGTYVAFAGEKEIALRREELVLRGSGSIACGHRAAEAPAEIGFAVEP